MDRYSLSAFKKLTITSRFVQPFPFFGSTLALWSIAIKLWMAWG
jgi:hypothetical protein